MTALEIARNKLRMRTVETYLVPSKVFSIDKKRGCSDANVVTHISNSLHPSAINGSRSNDLAVGQLGGFRILKLGQLDSSVI